MDEETAKTKSVFVKFMTLCWSGRGLLARALTFSYISYHSSCWLTLPIVVYIRIFVKNNEGDLVAPLEIQADS